MKTKGMYFKRQHIIRELLELLQVDENAGEKEKIAAVQETTLFYIYYVLILDESHTNFDRIKKINAGSTNPLDKLRIENSKKEVDLYDAYCNCLKGIDVLYEAILSDESVEILQELVDKNVGEDVEGVDYRFEFGDDPEYFVEFYIDQNEGNDEYICTVCQDNHFRIFDAEMEELAENPLEFFEMLAEGIWCVEKTYVNNDRLFASYDFEKVMEYLEDEFDATMYDCDDVQIVRYSDDTYDYCIDTRNITDYVSFGGRSDDE